MTSPSNSTPSNDTSPGSCHPPRMPPKISSTFAADVVPASFGRRWRLFRGRWLPPGRTVGFVWTGVVSGGTRPRSRDPALGYQTADCEVSIPRRRRHRQVEHEGGQLQLPIVGLKANVRNLHLAESGRRRTDGAVNILLPVEHHLREPGLQGRGQGKAQQNGDKHDQLPPATATRSRRMGLSKRWTGGQLNRLRRRAGEVSSICGPRKATETDLAAVNSGKSQINYLAGRRIQRGQRRRWLRRPR